MYGKCISLQSPKLKDEGVCGWTPLLVLNEFNEGQQGTLSRNQMEIMARQKLHTGVLLLAIQ